MDVNNSDCLEYMDRNCSYGSKNDTAFIQSLMVPPSDYNLQPDDRVDYDEDY